MVNAFLSKNFLGKFVGFFAVIFLVLFLFTTKTSFAQSAAPQFLMTWKTSGSYIPSFYKGKALPTYGSQITASLELVSGGKLVDLRSQTIYWYLNDTLIGGGTGVQSVTFPPFGEPPSILDLRVVLPSYNGQYLVHQIEIPMVNSEVVIYAPYPNGNFSTNPVSFTALPYFFNTTSANNLTYAWSVNGQSGTSAENPEEAQVTLPQGTTAGTQLQVQVTATNNQDSTNASAAQTLTFENQL